ncbi:hypothetical protein HZS61_006371 [Fusarium oxysporum f. sp. conglutinans]|uniref:Zn(2)-C6 fungal-type domain-containing protein n=1 Tax=Fusarium oxysporum f. sp. conglutinans TaxID=100902 RepID=A0A8H6LCI4_FUSOX|nr:hypothetical protein HZS61_006371 [Fusarium oxysporum f. sp. conglutinans]
MMTAVHHMSNNRMERNPIMPTAVSSPPFPVPPLPDGHPNYHHIPADVYENPPVGNDGAPQEIQSQRAAFVACAVHCFDSQSGKCQNCARRNETCIFELKFSSNRAAAIPVSAFPGGIPPVTQLFGAYGQPLAPGTVPASSPPHSAVNKNPSRRSPAEFSNHSS